MAALGQAQTQSFSIGTAELRLGSMNSAGDLTQRHSVGLLQSASVNVSRQYAELRGGFANKRIHQAQIGYDVEVNANLYEFSTRNLNLLLANSFEKQGTYSKLTSIAKPGVAFPLGGLSHAVIPSNTSHYFTVPKDSEFEVTVGEELASVISTGDFTEAVSVYLNVYQNQKIQPTSVTMYAKRTSETTIKLKAKKGDLYFVATAAATQVTMRITEVVSLPTALTELSSAQQGHTVEVGGLVTITLPLDDRLIPKAVNSTYLLGIYAQNKPEQLALVEAYHASSTHMSSNTLTFKTPSIFTAAAETTPLVVYRANPITLAPQESQQYFTCDLVSQNKKTKKVQGFRLWKVAFQGEIPLNFSGTDYNTLPLKLVAFEPDEEDLVGDLAEVANLVRAHTFGMHWGG